MRTLLFSLLALLSLAWALPARADDPAITTTGTATVYAVPDQALFTVNITAIDPDVTKACAKNEADGSKLVKAIKAAAIADRDIATNAIDISIHYRDTGAGGQRAERDGFQATRTYCVTLHDLTQVMKVFNAIVLAGVEATPSVDLQVANSRTYKDQARTMAVHAALEKANTLAKELNCTVGKAHTVVEGSPVSRYYAMQSNSNAENFATDRPTPDTPESTPIGRLEIQASVTVTFDLK